MPSTSHAGGRMLFVIRQRGPQPKLDIMIKARELAQFRANDASLTVLFDWSELDSWPFQGPSVATVRAWKDAVPSITRAAILHDPKWTCHAALLAALLRGCHAVVALSCQPILTARSPGSNRTRS